MTYYYAVKAGRNPGVYSSWSDCQSEVNGYSGAKFKKFSTQEEAEAFAHEGDQSSTHNPPARITPVFKQPTQVKRHYESEEPENYNHHTGSSSRKYTKPSYNQSIASSSSQYTSLSYGQYEKKKKSVVYTDGACSRNGQNAAQAGYGVYWGENDSRNTSEKLLGNQTNQRAEAMAVIHALKQSQKAPEALEIRTDSRYVINAITSWSKKWTTNGWKSSNGKPVENRDVFEEILGLIEKRKAPVEFTYVAGHSGEEGNEKADRLAVEGAQKNNVSSIV